MADNNLRLIEAIENDDIGGVQKSLDNGADINWIIQRPLCFAVELHRYEITKLLIDRGANIDTDLYLLFYACGNSEIMELLLKEGVICHCGESELIKQCIRIDDNQSLELLINYNIVEIATNKLLYYLGGHATIFDKCLQRKAKNILEFIIINYPHIIPDIVNTSLIKRKDIKKYNFIKMLIERNFIDIAD